MVQPQSLVLPTARRLLQEVQIEVGRELVQ